MSTVGAGGSCHPESDIRAQHGEEDSHTGCSSGMDCRMPRGMKRTSAMGDRVALGRMLNPKKNKGFSTGIVGTAQNRVSELGQNEVSTPVREGMQYNPQ